jgi:hypothetical protein
VTTEYAYLESEERKSVPSDVTGIRLARSYYSCGYRAVCELDDVSFEIRIYAQ